MKNDIQNGFPDVWLEDYHLQPKYHSLLENRHQLFPIDKSSDANNMILNLNTKT